MIVASSRWRPLRRIATWRTGGRPLAGTLLGLPRLEVRSPAGKLLSTLRREDRRSKKSFAFGRPKAHMRTYSFRLNAGGLSRENVGWVPFSQKDLGKLRTAGRCARWMQNIEWKRIYD